MSKQKKVIGQVLIAAAFALFLCMPAHAQQMVVHNALVKVNHMIAGELDRCDSGQLGRLKEFLGQRSDGGHGGYAWSDVSVGLSAESDRVMLDNLRQALLAIEPVLSDVLRDCSTSSGQGDMLSRDLERLHNGLVYLDRNIESDLAASAAAREQGAHATAPASAATAAYRIAR